MTPKTAINISKILPFGIIWMFFSIVFVLIERGLLGDLDYYPATGNPYSFVVNLWLVGSLSLVSGLLVGSFEVLYLSRVFRTKSFGKKLLYKILIYVGIMIAFLLIISIVNNSIRLQTNLLNKDLWKSVDAFFFNFAFWSVEIYMASLIGVSLFYSQVSENLGHGVLMNFFTGKYHTPIEEERIFMFLDMKSSTTIAEQLGHVRYFELLKAYYADLSAPVVDYLGEIYQYVGDELVVSWKLTNGLTNNNCYRCYQAMKEVLQKQAPNYQSTFGLVPDFKAGLHLGRVTTGEIGVLKKDIIFTGDVLNTTARIQGLCKPYQVDLLLSASLLDKLSFDDAYQFKSFGENKLRGRDEKIELFTILSENR